MHDWARIPTEQYPDSLFASGRLQEFIASRGENWEVNNCCIDGEGRCFFTVARSKVMSPVEERGEADVFGFSFTCCALTYLIRKIVTLDNAVSNFCNF